LAAAGLLACWLAAGYGWLESDGAILLVAG